MKRKEETKLKKRPLNIRNKSKKTPKKSAQKKRKISKNKESPESSGKSDYSVNDSTDESPDRSQNVMLNACIVMGFFLKIYSWREIDPMCTL